MAEYIERKAVLDAYDEVQRRNGPWRFETLIESVPAADVAPVVHGHWQPTGYPFMSECEDCSKCGYRTVYGHRFKFCPYCGAKMDGGQHETD